MDHTLALIGRAHQGDKAARDTLFEENTGLVYSVAKRFLGRGIPMEDLFQIGSIGLLKAVDHFDVGSDVKFSTYAVPMIVGEIKRFLRDDGMVKVSRSMKEICARAYAAREQLEQTQDHEPTVEEIAEKIRVMPEELVIALDSAAEVESLSRTIYQGDGSSIALMDKLREKKNGQEEVLDRLFLKEMLDSLEEGERNLLIMRYFQECTQSQIAGKLGVSQVQVSRMEKRILKKLRGSFDG